MLNLSAGESDERLEWWWYNINTGCGFMRLVTPLDWTSAYREWMEEYGN